MYAVNAVLQRWVCLCFAVHDTAVTDQLQFGSNAAVPIGRITHGSWPSVRPFVCLSVPYTLLTLKTKKFRKTKISVNVPPAGVTGVPIFSSKGQGHWTSETSRN